MEIIENPTEYVGKKVHVEGWKFGSVFLLEGYSNGYAILRTPSTRKRTMTKNRLIKTRRDETQ